MPQPRPLNLPRIAALLRELADELERDPPTASTTVTRGRAALEPFVGVKDVVAQLGCSESVAYTHLRRAAKRRPGARGLLRVRASVWQAYLDERDQESAAPSAPHRRTVRPSPRGPSDALALLERLEARPPIRQTQPVKWLKTKREREVVERLGQK